MPVFWQAPAVHQAVEYAGSHAVIASQLRRAPMPPYLSLRHGETRLLLAHGCLWHGSRHGGGETQRSRLPQCAFVQLKWLRALLCTCAAICCLLARVFHHSSAFHSATHSFIRALCWAGRCIYVGSFVGKKGAVHTAISAAIVQCMWPILSSVGHDASPAGAAHHRRYVRTDYGRYTRLSMQ